MQGSARSTSSTRTSGRWTRRCAASVMAASDVAASRPEAEELWALDGVSQIIGPGCQMRGHIYQWAMQPLQIIMSDFDFALSFGFLIKGFWKVNFPMTMSVRLLGGLLFFFCLSCHNFSIRVGVTLPCFYQQLFNNLRPCVHSRLFGVWIFIFPLTINDTYCYISFTQR